MSKHHSVSPCLCNICVAAQRPALEAGGRASGVAPGVADVGGGRLRLGLRVEQRGSVRKHVAALQQRLERAAADMQARPCLKRSQLRILCLEAHAKYLTALQQRLKARCRWQLLWFLSSLRMLSLKRKPAGCGRGGGGGAGRQTASGSAPGRAGGGCGCLCQRARGAGACSGAREQRRAAGAGAHAAPDRERSIDQIRLVIVERQV